MDRLDTEMARELLQRCPQWRYSTERGGMVTREFVFKDFVEAFAFMTHVALWAERHDHHPEWSNVYNRLTVTLTTHDVNGLSMKDIELATVMDKLIGEASNRPADT